MIQTPLYFSTLSYNWEPHQKFLRANFDNSSAGGKFHIMVSRLLSDNMLIPRDGEWSLPWKTTVHPIWQMPVYDPTFKKSFAEVTDERAINLGKLINEGKKFFVFYSGGIDSVVCLTSLIKNLTTEQLERVTIVMSIDSVVENPTFYTKFIVPNFKKLLDSNTFRYDNIGGNYYGITMDQGDSLFGTEFGTKMYARYDELVNCLSEESKKKLIDLHSNIISADTHYSTYADLLIHYFSLSRFGAFPNNLEFGKLFYEKIVKNIETSSVPIHSLHDFFWWVIFNIKYIHCGIRLALYFGGDQSLKMNVTKNIINWFGSEDYQKWSMVNNNNGQKIAEVGQTHYKWAAKQYIHAFDNNDWYLHYKTKIGSLRNLMVRNFSALHMDSIFGVDHNFEVLRITDKETEAFLIDKLQSYQIDW